jgi:hypothetical protein
MPTPRPWRPLVQRRQSIASDAAPPRQCADGGLRGRPWAPTVRCRFGRLCCWRFPRTRAAFLYVADGIAATMYITDLTHFLDRSGAIGPVNGPPREMAQFHVDVVAHATDETSTRPPAPRCFKCKKGVVDALVAKDHAILWTCLKCRTEGRIAKWQGSLWDLRARPATSS